MPRTSFPLTQLQKFNVNGKIENFLRCQLSFLSQFTLLISSSTQSNSLRERYKTKIIPSSCVGDIADDLVWIEQRNKWNWSILCIHSCRFWSSHSVQGGPDRPVLSARCTLTSCLTVWWNSFIKGRLFQIIRIQDGPQAILWQEVPPKQVNLSSFLSFVNSIIQVQTSWELCCTGLPYFFCKQPKFPMKKSASICSGGVFSSSSFL